MSSVKASVTAANFDAVLFDLDGVLTATAKVHAACWKKTFDDYLKQRAATSGEPFQPFNLDRDWIAPSYLAILSNRFKSFAKSSAPWQTPW